MKRTLMISLALLGCVLVLVLVGVPRGRAQGPKHNAGLVASVVHSPALGAGKLLRGDDGDEDCERFLKKADADDRDRDRDDGDAEHDGDDRDRRIRRGFEIAPVPLNLKGKNCRLVGLGSYLVNAANCNDCHSNGPATQFVMGGNPFFGQPKLLNPKTYLGGGRVFPPVVPGSAPIIARNLTPGKTGLPEGDHTFAEFLQILRTGVDLDHLHPTCPAGVVNTSCVPAPFRGDLLQVMPWPNTQELTKHDIRAIYEYLRAIPCIQGNYPNEPADRCK
jgi:hypothetical protein